MTMRKVESPKLFIESDLVAEANEIEIETDTGDEQGHGTDGSGYHQMGNDTTQANVTMIVPVDATGANVRFDDAVAAKEDFVLTGYVGGRFGHCDAFVKNAKYKGSPKNGGCESSVTMHGSKWNWGPPS